MESDKSLLADLGVYLREVFDRSLVTWDRAARVSALVSALVATVVALLVLFGIAPDTQTPGERFALTFLATWFVVLLVFVTPFRMWRELKLKVAELSVHPEPIGVLELAKIARDKFGWDFAPETNEFEDFQTGLRQCHKDKRLLLRGLKGFIGPSMSRVLAATRLHDDIPIDHLERHWIYAHEFVGTGNLDNKLVHTDHPAAMVPARDRYGDIQISNRNAAVRWLEHEAGRLRGNYKQAAALENAKREARERQLKREEESK